jgi:glycosyltransferase involved in cell wall biosynthesis
MRVLTITNTFPPAQTGGAEVSARWTARGLRQRGMDCRVLTVNNRTERPIDRYYWEGVPVHQVALPARRAAVTDVFDRHIYRAVLAEIRSFKPDLVHVHNVSGSSLAPFVACRSARVPVVLTLHDHWLLCPNNMLYRRNGELCDPAGRTAGCSQCFRRYDFWGNLPARRRILAALVQNVRTFLAPSQALIDLHVRGGYERARFKLVRYGMPATAPAEPRHSGVQRLQREQGQYRTVVFAGGGVVIKGAGVLLEALPLLVRHVDQLRVVVAGGGEQTFFTQLGAFAPTVVLMGWVPHYEMPALQQAADLTLVPSLWAENSPLMIQQSLLVGTPAAGAAVGGIPELLREGETGYLFRQGDAADLAEKVILHFARPSAERRQMRRLCQTYASDHLGYEQHLDEVADIYRRAASGA